MVSGRDVYGPFEGSFFELYLHFDIIRRRKGLEKKEQRRNGETDGKAISMDRGLKRSSEGLIRNTDKTMFACQKHTINRGS